MILIDWNKLQAALESDGYLGFCLACGAQQGQVEPDARNYKCETCGKRQVFGAEEVLIMGRHTAA